ncbi:DUF871 domain-containing protein [Malacoplasma iowae]|uniref:DUF871 superfamily protein n=1 Tax=Malacoplasma iowae DK-CPA TaxID=1394179 RepID=A0A084U4J0_MALIO|nr:MupG family TIM beta-alpha barrel fold protein [Malacoplasma iowae]KFB07876.1 DUF871 superfamily protein [Malacoplasma iowae DK-CPA]WPL36557.1 MupG family TIM beta-alpha barrel fold protein [Malacoplasma iowae]WPL41177.1 MupG family TIM beta-alpha barrel fold protein [Malacoplasma iowae]
MARLGISIYPNLISVDQCINYIDLAYKCGFSRIFTNFLEIENESEMNNFKKVCNYAKSKNFEIIFDVNPSVFETIKKQTSDPLLFFVNLGASGIRMDEEYEGQFEAEFTKNKYGLKLEINASSTTGLLENIIKYNGDLKNVISCHNFYPQRFTGLDRKLFEEKCLYYKSKNIKVAAFVSSQNLNAIGPWPLKEGLPTIEDHRNISLVDQAKDLIATDYVDDIIISNQPATELEMLELSKLSHVGFNFHISLEKDITELEKRTLFDADVDYMGKKVGTQVRQDYSPYMIRCTAPRIKFSNNPIEPKPINKKYFEIGDVLVLNKEFGRYNGEVQIVMKQMPYDSRKNYLGKINKNDIELFKYIKPNKKIKFIEV